MNISYNWLKEYIDFDLGPQEVADAMTSIGLETGSVKEVQNIKGGLEGLVIGEVMTCIPHPNSDHLHITTVDIGAEDLLPIVCGAPNVAAGQKVVVATVGTTLYDGDESFKIKKSKIRGEVSMGMICAEDEIGVGGSHEGIIELPTDVKVGTLAKDYYQVNSDYVIEVDITPNRVDGTSHYGVARDLYAYFKQHTTQTVELKKPSVEAFKIDTPEVPITLHVENNEACMRYLGLSIKGITVKESPAWLKDKLNRIGLRPINNIVDISNFVLFETGQPMHVFNADKITTNEVRVKTLSEGTKFVTLDGVERTLTDRDLMICDADTPMCIGGVFGGLDSGVKEGTTNIFLEVATFNPSWIRKTAHRFALNTDASFRYERGLDPNDTIYVMKRAALLVKELAGGTICGDIQDYYPEVMKPFVVSVTYKKINTLIGKDIPVETVKNILTNLEMKIVEENEEGLVLNVPVYRFDVRRDVDVIEDILRIYGYNNIAFKDSVHSNLSYETSVDKAFKLQNSIAEQLCGVGFNEIMNNSLTSMRYYEELESYPIANSVKLMNPLSADLNVMRQTMLFGGLESVEHNSKRQLSNLRFFEFGNCYCFNEEKKKEDNPVAQFSEDARLALWMSGKRTSNNWAHPDEETTVYELKANVQNILRRLGVNQAKVVYGKVSNDIYSAGLKIVTTAGRELGSLGVIKKSLCTMMDIDNEVFYAELSWTALMKEIRKTKVKFTDISKFPTVKRDLALLIDHTTTFAEIEAVARKSEKKLLRGVELFDVYEGKNLPEGKKSYAVSFYLRDDEKTLKDKQIENIMKKILKNLENQLEAKLR